MSTLNFKNLSASDILKVVGTLAELANNATAAYREGKRLAQKAGISQEDLDAALVRFQKHYDDPLAGETEPEPTHEEGSFPYITILDEDPREDERLKFGDAVYASLDGHWWVLPNGVGMPSPPGFRLEWTKE